MQESFEVLVACSANVCRSPLAASVMRSALVALRPAVHVSWAGTFAAVGDAMCPQAASYVGLAGAIGDSRQLTPALLKRADLLLTADRTQRAWIARMDPASRQDTFTIRQAARLATWVAQFVASGSTPPGAQPFPDSTLDRLRWLVVEMDAARGMLASWDPQHDDIEDRHGDIDHRGTLDQVAHASTALAEAFIAIAQAGQLVANAMETGAQDDALNEPAFNSPGFSLKSRLPARLRGQAPIQTQADLQECLRTENLGHIASTSRSFNQILMTPRPEIEQHLKRALGQAALQQSKVFPAAVVITSANPGSGKTATAVNLAMSFVESGRSVMLIDACLHNSKLGAYLGVDSEVGLPDVLAGVMPLSQAELTWHRGALRVLPRGPHLADATALLASEQMELLLADLKTQVDLVIINAPPLLSSTDAAVIGAIADGAVIVVGRGRTTCKQLESAARLLDEANVKLLGTIMTFAEAIK